MSHSEKSTPISSDDPSKAQVLGLFQGYGLEIEYALVAEQTLDVMPIALSVLRELGANDEGTAELGAIAWSNELAAHVIELKSNGPVGALSDASTCFPEAVRNLNDRLRASGARLMPSGMHPWMDPSSEFRLYPIDEGGYYRAFDRIFDCKGHGWSNLQSMHINLPFLGDEEFGLLHSAIRLLLPIMPALSASSPFTEGKRQPELDHRLFVYRDNAKRVPSVSGLVVPEHSESQSA